MEESQSIRSKRIAKNTMYLYIRTFVVMLVSLYTSRVILHTLGETDYGVYNLVGGAAVMFTFINSAMTSSTQRYLNVAIGKRLPESITKVFSSSVAIHLAITSIFLLLSETIGLWFVNNKLNISSDRATAAFWVYQLSILGACLNIIRCPFNATIVAYERMDYFAKISIVEALLKLGISFAIMYAPVDRLIFYSSLLLLSGFIITLWCKSFCYNNFTAIRVVRPIDKPTVKTMMGFSLWSLLGSGSMMASNQGINMMLNIYFNVIVNAAMGIAYQVNTAASTLVSNFQTAFMPQITKSYAANERKYLTKLLYAASRYSFLLCFVISFPIFTNCDAILRFWLSEYPEYTPGLIKVIIICVGLDALSGPLWMIAHAKGDIRNYQITVSLFLLSTLAACYIAVKLGYTPVVAFGSRILILTLLYAYRLLYAKQAMSLSVFCYIKKAILRCGVIVVLAVPFAYVTSFAVSNNIVKVICDLLCALLLSYLIGFNSSERKMLITWCTKLPQRFNR